jgi:Fe-S-cluster containining protein
VSLGRRFRCMACGSCCHGQVPLTCPDAFANAGLFPLGFVWTPIRQGSKDFAQAASLGVTVQTPDRKTLAVLVGPAAYLPADLACPALTADRRCAIHERKPARCRTMPFFPHREERFQAELLTPRPGWRCDTSAAAPLVYQDGQVLHRDDFDAEREALLAQLPAMRRYADYLLKYAPALVGSLMVAAGSTRAGHVVTSLSSFFTATRHPDARALAAQQLPVLLDHAARTAGRQALAEFHRNYAGWAKEMAYLAKAPR